MEKQALCRSSLTSIIDVKESIIYVQVSLRNEKSCAVWAEHKEKNIDIMTELEREKNPNFS